MIVRELRSGEEARWDEFVQDCEYSTPQHLSAWKQVMEEAFNSETHYFLAEEDNQITGILPLIHIKSLIAGHYVTSFPGGLCADDDETAGAMLDHAREFVRATDSRYLILRDGRKKWDLPGLITDEEHVTFLIEVHSDLANIRHAMKSKTRQLVNHVNKNGLKAMPGWDKLGEYYPIYSKAMRAFGNPTLGLGFFSSLEAHIPEEADLITLYYMGMIVGGGFVAPFKKTVYCLWSGLLKEYYDMRTSYSLSWESIRYAHRKGYQWVDLGRCRKNSGGFDFKKGFGGQVQQLYQQFYLNGVDRPPTVGAEMEEDLKYRMFVTLWRRLPLPATEVLGPMLRKQIPFG